MSYVIPAYSYEDETVETAPHLIPGLRFVPRSKYQWLAFIVPGILCAMSWMGGGVPALTDLGFLLFTIACGIFVCVEFYRFPVRFGIGGLVLWGGTLCWFCHDYFTNWYRHDFNSPIHYMEPWVIAKAATLHVFFMMMMSIGLSWQRGDWLTKVLQLIPTPTDNRTYLFLVLIMFVIGLSPFYIFNAEPTYLALYHAAFGSLTGDYAHLTAYRTGNLNYSWSAYVAQIFQIGEVGGIFAILYALMITRNIAGRVLGLVIWTFWALVAFGTGRRGEISFALLPPIALLFIKFQARAAVLFKKFSIRAYLICGLLTVGLLWVVQFQGTFRDTGFGDADLSKLDITKNQGNTMFSEGLVGYSLLPDVKPFFRDSIPGEAWIRPMPQVAFDFVIGVIPRALWNDKPFDASWKWYNELITGDRDGTVGTTISHGLVGSWYFSYGVAGVVEGGLLVGWLMGCAERALQNSDGQPIRILMSLAFSVWLFRVFRDFIFIDLYGLIIGGVVLSVLIRVTRPLFAVTPATA